MTFLGAAARVAGVLALFVTVLASPSFALTSGTYVGTYSGNDPFDGSGGGVLMGEFAMAKCGDSGNTCVDGPSAGDYSDNFTMTGAGTTSGKWTFTSQVGEALRPVLLVLKAGNAYSVYNVAGLFGGFWDTNPTLLNNQGMPQEISHISFYGSPAPVPLPAALPLFAAGLLAFGAAKRRRKAA
jgi:hypothetical protein